MKISNINDKNYTTLGGRAQFTDHPIRYYPDVTTPISSPSQATFNTHINLSRQSQYFAIICNYIVISLSAVSLYTTQQLTVDQTTKKVYFGMTTGWRSRYWKLRLVSSLAISGIVFCADRTRAQIAPDTTLGAENSIVTPNVIINELPSDQIDGGAIRGANLFHSFSEFNVGEGRGAYFSNPVGVENILSRVTGGNPSNILGKLGVLGNANLFLINPNGIIFGPNASLNVGGSFVGSTASSLSLADGTQFSAIAPQTTPMLNISVPFGLQFGSNAGSIQVQGNGQGRRITSGLIDTTVGLRVQPDQTLALVGGDVTLEGGTLKTAGGRIELGSVAGSGLVSLTPIDKGWALGYVSIPTFGDIQLSQQASVDASGEGGGDIQVQVRRVTLNNGSGIEASTLGAEAGGNLTMTASESVEVIGESADGQFGSALNAHVYSRATGVGGNLTLKTGRLIIRDGAGVGAITDGGGSTGTLAVTASESVELIGIGVSGFPSSLGVDTIGDSTGGNVTIGTKRLLIQDGALLAARTFFGTGRGGDLTVNASESVEVIGESESPAQLPPGATSRRSGSAISTETTGDGTARDLTVITGRLIARDGGQVSASTRRQGAGQGGNLKVIASASVELIGTNSDGRSSSGLFTRTEGAGAAGDLTIDTGQLIVLDEAQVAVNSLGSGNAGNLVVIARDLLLDKQGELIATTASGQGGNITLQAQNLLLMRHNSQISTTAGTAGAGGDGGDVSAPTQENTSTQIVEAQGWEINLKGEVLLTAQAHKVTPHSSGFTSASCHDL